MLLVVERPGVGGQWSVPGRRLSEARDGEEEEETCFIRLSLRERLAFEHLRRRLV